VTARATSGGPATGTDRPAGRDGRRRRFDWFLLLVLLVDTVLLALVEVFFLPLRFDGTLLPDLGSWPFPITALLAGVSMPLLVSRAADVSPRLPVAGAPLAVWLVTIGVVGLAGVENMVLLEDWRTLLLLGAGTLPGAVALGNALARRARATAEASGKSGSKSGAGQRRRS
jgi:hypothetical protein